MFGHNEITGKKFFAESAEAAAGKLLVTSIFHTIQGEGPFAGVPAVFVRLAKCQLQCRFCFVPSTPIQMGDNTYKRIDEIKVGDVVMSWSGTDFEPKRVTKTYRSVAKHLVQVDVSNRKVWCTPEHPFLVSGRGWVAAEDLRPGDRLVHWNVHARMRMFNPHKFAGPMSAKARTINAERMTRLWDRPGFRERQRERMRNNNPMHDPEVALRSFMTREDRGRRTSLEKFVEEVCAGLPIYYCADVKFSVAHKIPDFKVIGQDKLIEVWASDALWAIGRDQIWVRKRRALFARHGFSTLFLPVIQQARRLVHRPVIRQRVAEFINNGATVRGVTKVGKKGLARLYGRVSAPRYVYNLEVEDNHTYVANTLVVHNCDTYFDSGDWMFPREVIFKAIEACGGGPVPSLLVVTGGEPTLQNRALRDLLESQSRFRDAQIETNGLIAPDVPRSTVVVVSPKCAEVNGKPRPYARPADATLERAHCLKFVMCADSASPYSAVPDWALEWHERVGRAIYISPMAQYCHAPGATQRIYDARRTPDAAERAAAERVSFWEPNLLDMAACRANYEYAAAYVLRHDLRLTIQQHLFASLP